LTSLSAVGIIRIVSVMADRQSVKAR